jgi:hypothetical protein
MTEKTLEQVVAEAPFDDFQNWWQVGAIFISFMSSAILPEWSKLPNNEGSLVVSNYLDIYHQLVYKRETSPNLLDDFIDNNSTRTYYSGEFDALSYAFYRAAFELIEKHGSQYENGLEIERRQFTKRVGSRFFEQVYSYLSLDLPTDLSGETQFLKLNENIQRVGAFLLKQGYLRDHFAFKFDVTEQHQGENIKQEASNFVDTLKNAGMAHALYEMGYPIILPSAVCLFHTIGEAQHHSSRTIEELFKQLGYRAYEVDDFDPSEYPSELVVELWEIQKL